LIQPCKIFHYKKCLLQIVNSRTLLAKIILKLVKKILKKQKCPPTHIYIYINRPLLIYIEIYWSNFKNKEKVLVVVSHTNLRHGEFWWMYVPSEIMIFRFWPIFYFSVLGLISQFSIRIWSKMYIKKILKNSLQNFQFFH